MEIIKIPGVNGLGKTKGCEEGGNEVIKDLREIYSNENNLPIDVDSLDFEEIHLDNSDIEKSNKLIYEKSSERYEINSKSFFLGGDHSISYPLVKGFLDYCNKREKEPCLIIFDSHPDCMDSVDREIPTHEEWVRSLVEKGFPPKNILMVGARNSYKEEIEYIREKGIKVMDMNNFVGEFSETVDILTEFCSGKEAYVSIDIDSIDPAFAPATGYAEPGGFTSREFIYMLRRINKIKNLRAIDLVEINPKKDVDRRTTKLGAKVLSEFID